MQNFSRNNFAYVLFYISYYSIIGTKRIVNVFEIFQIQSVLSVESIPCILQIIIIHVIK